MIVLGCSLTIDGLQLIVPEDQCDKAGTATQTQQWHPLQEVVSQVQVFQLTERLQNKGEP